MSDPLRPVFGEYETMPVERLIPYARNARTHSDGQIAEIAASIVEFGFTNPILVAADGMILAGHGRLLAAQRLGMAEVPVIVLAHLNAAQRRALVIADNKIAENAGWNEELLAAELRALQDEGFELEILGFSDDELADILGGLEDEAAGLPALGDPDHVPETAARPVTVRGDIWCLGDHRVMCGDSTSLSDMGLLCGERLVDACWTDPPYNVNYEGSAGSIKNDNMSAKAFRKFLSEAFKAAHSVMRAGAPIYVAHADTEGVNFRRGFEDAGFKLSGCLVWVKPSLVLGRSDYQWRHEPILYGWKPGAAHSWYGGRANTTVIDQPGAPLRVMPDGTLQIDLDGQVLVISGKDIAVEALDQSILRFDKPARNAEHPTMKPVALISEMLGNSTKAGDLVLDPFGGSGSTLIACHQDGRIARLMELDEKFVDVIVRRWQEFTGLEAVLDGDRRSFADLASRRQAA